MFQMLRSGIRPAFLVMILLAGDSIAFAQVFQVGEDSVVAEALATITAMKLDQGRLKMDIQRWRDDSYPPENGNQTAQLIKDRSNHGRMPDDIESWINSRGQDLLSLFSANKQLIRLMDAIGATSYGGGVSSDLRFRFANRESSAAFRASVGPFNNITIAGRRPTIQELALDDNPTLLFRLHCRVEGRMGMLTQNRAGRIQLVYQSDDGPIAQTWKSYRAMRDDPGFPAPLLNDLKSLSVSMPAADSDSNVEVPPSFLTDGPLPSAKRSIFDLVKLSLDDGRIGFDRKSWLDKAGVGPIENQQDRPDDPFGDDPFADPFKRIREQNRLRRRREQSPLGARIESFSADVKATGRSSGGNAYQREIIVRGETVVAAFLEAKLPDRVKMTFKELTRHGRVLTLDDIPEDSFLLFYGDPDRSMMFLQDESGKISVASCTELETSIATLDSYDDFTKNEQGRALATTLREIGVVFPKPPSE